MTERKPPHPLMPVVFGPDHAPTPAPPLVVPERAAPTPEPPVPEPPTRSVLSSAVAGRFVSRHAAETVARASGQLAGDLIGSVLTTEDLW